MDIHNCWIVAKESTLPKMYSQVMQKTNIFCTGTAPATTTQDNDQAVSFEQTRRANQWAQSKNKTKQGNVGNNAAKKLAKQRLVNV